MFEHPETVVRVIGHRGAAGSAPENTLASFRRAAELGVSWVEMDVSLLADSGTVIFHDENLDRCTDGHGRLNTKTLAELKALDAGRWFADEFAGEPIPTLSEALAEIQRLKLGLNLEIKHDGPGIETLVRRVLCTLEQEWQDPNRLLLSSFNHQALLLCQQWAPVWRRGQLYEHIPAQWARELAEIDAYSLHCNYRHLTPAVARQIKHAGYWLLCYTANEPLKVAQHWAWGVDAFFSDFPERFIGLNN